jgi:hypothetical protein
MCAGRLRLCDTVGSSESVSLVRSFLAELAVSGPSAIGHTEDAVASDAVSCAAA